MYLYIMFEGWVGLGKRLWLLFIILLIIMGMDVEFDYI